MKFSHISVIATISVFLFSCNSKKNVKTMESTENNNPFFQNSSLQYQAPEFDKIKDEHFEPAFKKGLAEQLIEIENIANSTEAATFKNTILALETSGRILNRATMVFYNLTSANTNDSLQALEEKYAPIFAAHHDKIYLNSKLFERVKTVYENRNNANLESEDIRLTEYYYQNFEIAGANLSEEKKGDLKRINEQLASLETAFSNKLLAARKNGALIIDDVKELDGMSADEIAAAAKDAEDAGHKGKYLLALQNTTQQPLLQNLTNRATREKLYKASWERADKGNNDDTRATIQEIAKLRLQKAQLLGKTNFAEWKLQDQMAKDPQNALNLLSKLAAPAVNKAKTEASEIQKMIDAEKSGFKLEPWDWNFYAEKVRKAKYDLDESEIKPYFEVRTVLEKGVFYAAEQLYGISFKVRTDLPVYHPDVVAYEVFDKDGSSIALYYLDFYTRDNKSGGAWMNNFVNQSHHLGQKPVITNVFNYQKPANGKPSLISFDDVTTMFHEFGHSIHGIFANQKYESLSGTSVPRDFVEFPSQINEHWAMNEKVLNNYALHYKTKQPIPAELVQKIKNAGNFNGGYSMTELVAAATLDLAWHTVANADKLVAANDFEKAALESYGLYLPYVPPRYHSSYFLHIWANGYSAGYYAYMWSEMLDFDCFQWFEDNGGLTRENGDKFRQHILSVGNSIDLNESFKALTGHEPTIKPLLKAKGF